MEGLFGRTGTQPFAVGDVAVLHRKRSSLLSVRLSEEERCQLDSLLINMKVPMYAPEKNRNHSQSERFRMLLEVLAPRVDYWHWLKWSRVRLDDDGSLRVSAPTPLFR